MSLSPSECLRDTRVYNTLTEKYGKIFMFDALDDMILVDYDDGSTRWDSIHLFIKCVYQTKSLKPKNSEAVCPICGESAYIGFLTVECKSKDCPNYKN